MDRLSWQSRIAHFIMNERERMVRYIHRYIDDTDEWSGEDIVQDVMLNIFNRADFTIPIENLTAYVYQSIRNRIIDYLRKRKDHISLDAENLNYDGLSLADILPDPRYKKDNVDLRIEIRQRFFQALEKLNDKERDLVISTELENRSFKEMAEVLGVPVGTLLARKSRAMKKIRKELSDLENR